MERRVSLKDIAQKVGVSIALVSYVLNNQKEGRINKDVAQRIRDIAKELNYRTNQIAKSLKTNKTFTIGLIVADISNPFFSGLARMIEDEADKHNYTVIFGSSDENVEKFEKLINVFSNRQVDGLIISPPDGTEAQLTALLKQRIPFVLIDRYYPDLPVSYVALDNFVSAYQATEYILRSGCKNPCMVTYHSSLFNLKERTRGFKAALEHNGILFKKRMLKEINLGTEKTEIEVAVHDVVSMKNPADAILFGSNSIADCGVRYINTLPVKVPQDLSIITFDEPVALDLFYAPITYIKQPLPEMGKQAINVLLENINKINKFMQLNLKGELIVRASTK